jgi:hypothetical protein
MFRYIQQDFCSREEEIPDSELKYRISGFEKDHERIQEMAKDPQI